MDRRMNTMTADVGVIGAVAVMAVDASGVRWSRQGERQEGEGDRPHRLAPLAFTRALAVAISCVTAWFKQTSATTTLTSSG